MEAGGNFVENRLLPHYLIATAKIYTKSNARFEDQSLFKAWITSTGTLEAKCRSSTSTPQFNKIQLTVLERLKETEEFLTVICIK